MTAPWFGTATTRRVRSTFGGCRERGTLSWFVWKSVPGHVLGRPELEEVFPALTVIPMGWVLAVFLFQHIHRRLALLPPTGSALPLQGEWRRDARRPLQGLSLPSPDGVEHA